MVSVTSLCFVGEENTAWANTVERAAYRGSLGRAAQGTWTHCSVTLHGRWCHGERQSTVRVITRVGQQVHKLFPNVHSCSSYCFIVFGKARLPCNATEHELPDCSSQMSRLLRP